MNVQVKLTESIAYARYKSCLTVDSWIMHRAAHLLWCFGWLSLSASVGR